MKSTEIAFRFPVLGFTPDHEIWGFQDLDQLTKCGPRTLRQDMQIGMALIDADLRQWKVLSVTRTGRAGRWWDVLRIFGPPQSRIVQDLEALAPVSMAEVRRLACLAMETFSESYLEGDDPAVEFEPRLENIRRAKSVSEIYDLIHPDTFEPC